MPPPDPSSAASAREARRCLVRSQKKCRSWPACALSNARRRSSSVVSWSRSWVTPAPYADLPLQQVSVEDTLRRGTIQLEHGRRSDRSRDEVATAVGARAHLGCTSRAEGALVRADARVGGVGRQIDITPLAGRPQIEHTLTVTPSRQALATVRFATWHRLQGAARDAERLAARDERI